MLAPKNSGACLKVAIFMCFSDDAIVYFIVPLTKYTECYVLPTHRKCITYKIVLACPECCDKRGISNLNIIAHKDCQICKANTALPQISDSANMCSSSKIRDKEETRLITEKVSSSSRAITIQVSLV